MEMKTQAQGGGREKQTIFFFEAHSEGMYLNRKYYLFKIYIYMFNHNYHNFKQNLLFLLGQWEGHNKYTLKSKTKTVFHLNQTYFPPKIIIVQPKKTKYCALLNNLNMSPITIGSSPHTCISIVC